MLLLMLIHSRIAENNGDGLASLIEWDLHPISNFVDIAFLIHCVI